MQIVRHDAEPVNVLLHLFGLEPAQVPITCWYSYTDAKRRAERCAHLLEERNIVVRVFGDAASVRCAGAMRRLAYILLE